MKVKSLSTLISDSKQINASFIFDDHLDGLSDFSLSYANDNQVYVTSFDSTISLYDFEAMKSIGVLKGHSKGVWTSSTCPNSNILLTGGNDNAIIAWDTKSNKSINQINKHNEVIYDVQFASNGKHFASCSKGMLCLWDIADLKEPIKTIGDNSSNRKPKSSFIYCLNFIDNDTKIISGYIDGTILIHDIANNKNDKHIIEQSNGFINQDEGLAPLKEYYNSVNSLSKFKSSNKILLSHSDGSVRIYNTASNAFQLEDSFQCKDIHLFFCSLDFCGSVTCSNTINNNEYIIGCGKDRSGQIWPTKSHNEINYSLIGHRNVVSYCDFLRNDLAATCSYDNTFRLWKIEL